MKNASLIGDKAWRCLGAKSAGLLAGLVLVAFIFGVRACFDGQRTLQESEYSERIVDKVSQTSQTCDVLRLLEAGETGRARQTLKRQLSGNLTVINSSLASADQPTREFAFTVCQMICQRRREPLVTRADTFTPPTDCRVPSPPPPKM